VAKRTKTSANQPRAKTQSAARTPMNGYERVAWVCLHLLAVLVPIAMTNPGVIGLAEAPLTFDQFDIIKVVLQRGIILIGLGAWLIGLLLKGSTLRSSRVEWVVLAFLAWVVVTTVFSVHPPTAVFGKYRRFEGLISFFTYASVFFLTLQLADRPTRIRSLVRTLVLASGLVALYGLGQAVGIDPIDWQRLPFEANRPFSTYGNPDLLGGYLMFPLLLSIGLALSEKDMRWRFAYWAIFVMNGLVLLMSFVRGAWIGGFVGLVVFAIAASRAKVKLTGMDWSFIGAGAAGGVAVAAASLTVKSSVMNFYNRIVSIFQFDRGSALTRFQIWEAAVDAIAERPILGWGADTFRLLFPRFKPAEYVAAAGYLSVADNVHNYPLQLATALGIPGVVLLYGLVIFALAVSARHAFARDTGAERLLVSGVWAAVVAYLVHLLFGLSVTGSTVFLWLCVGLLLSPVATRREVGAPAWGAWVVPVIALAVLAGTFFNVRYLAADHFYMRARVMTRGLERVDNARRAVELNPYNDMYRAEVAVAWQDAFINLAVAADPAQRDLAVKYFQNAEEAYRDTIAYVPMEYDNYVFLANLYNQGGFYLDTRYYEDAVEVGLEGVEVEPYGPGVRTQLAIAYMNLGRYDEAIEHAEFGAELDPRYVEIRAILGDAYRLAGRLEDARATYEEVLELAPDRTDAAAALESVEASLAAQGE